MRTEFYRRLDRHNTAPLWEVLPRLVPPQPQPLAVAALWRWADMRPLLLEAAALITAQEAERRVLVLENPGLRGTPAYASQITQSLYAGIQCITPGEVAPSHRHVTSALRFVMEGDGAYTAVDGRRIAMRPGDLILTPSWTVHDHGHEGETPVIWLDGLDIPIVNTFDASFGERYPQERQASRTEPDVSPLRFPYERARAELTRACRAGDIDPRHGIKREYRNPETGGPVLPTIAAFLQLLPKGFSGAPTRTTDATVYCVAEGSGVSRIGDLSVEWSAHDVFVVPSWSPVSHAADPEDAVLFSFSDRPAQKALGLWREDEHSL